MSCREQQPLPEMEKWHHEVELPFYDQQMYAQIDLLVERYVLSTKEFYAAAYEPPRSDGIIAFGEEFVQAVICVSHMETLLAVNEDPLATAESGESAKHLGIQNKKYCYISGGFRFSLLECAMVMHELHYSSCNKRVAQPPGEVCPVEYRDFWERVHTYNWTAEQAEQAVSQMDFWLNGTDPPHPEKMGMRALKIWHLDMGEAFEALRDETEDNDTDSLRSLIDNFNHICLYHYEMANAARGQLEDYLRQRDLPQKVKIAYALW